MNIELIAKMKTFDEFISAYRPGDELVEYKGKTLLFYSFSNNDPESRYKISSFLLEKGTYALGTNEEGETLLHILLSRVKHNLEQTTDLCRELISQGIDVNQIDSKGRVPLQYLINMNYTDEELWSLYELWLSQHDLLISHKNSRGVSQIELAEKLPYRSKLLSELKNRIEH